MLGYKDIDQCRRNYLLEFFNEHPDKPNQCCDNDTDLKKLKILIVKSEKKNDL